MSVVRAPVPDEKLDEIRSFSAPLAHPRDLDPLLERLAGVRCVLLGEASHGTSDYYTWRAQISRRLIVEHGFSFVAVEGDWPDCFRVNRWVKDRANGERSTRRSWVVAMTRSCPSTRQRRCTRCIGKPRNPVENRKPTRGRPDDRSTSRVPKPTHLNARR